MLSADGDEGLHNKPQLTGEFTGGVCPPYWPQVGLPQWIINREPSHFKSKWLLLCLIILAFLFKPSFSIFLCAHVQTHTIAIAVVQTILISHKHEQHLCVFTHMDTNANHIK